MSLVPPTASLGSILEAGVKATSDAVLVLNGEQLVVFANPALCQLVGAPSVEGRDGVDLVDSLSREPMSQAIERAARGLPLTVEVTLGHPPRALDLTVTALSLGGTRWTLCEGRLRPLPQQVEQRLGELNRRYDEKVRELAALTGKLRELATTDALTNLFNRRAFLDRAEVEWARARRHGLPLSCVVLDIDHFKRVNDQHGHAAGDEVIKLVGSILRTTVRASDVPARTGGEEFVALLPQTTRAGAALLAERVRTRIADQLVKSPAGVDLRVTCSAGVSSSESGYQSFSDLLAAADAALYLAKAAGRDCVRVAERLPATGTQ